MNQIKSYDELKEIDTDAIGYFKSDSENSFSEHDPIDVLLTEINLLEFTIKDLSRRLLNLDMRMELLINRIDNLAF